MAFRDHYEAPVQSKLSELGRVRREYGVYYHKMKRGLDIAFVLLTLPVSTVLVLCMMCLVALEGRSPLYFQKRLGRGGRVFRMVKIRTMVPGAEALLADHLCKNPEALREWNDTQKLKRDPRITRIGYFLRKSSLDELPQLWNVFTGDMSVVGPRPMMVNQKALYPGKAYFEVRPGITGPWQISDRNESSFADRARFDSRYVASMSFSQDLSILLRTVAVVMRGTGH